MPDTLRTNMFDKAALRMATAIRDTGRPHTVSLPTCAECLKRAAYLADLDTDGKPLDLFDTWSCDHT